MKIVRDVHPEMDVREERALNELLVLYRSGPNNMLDQVRGFINELLKVAFEKGRREDEDAGL